MTESLRDVVTEALTETSTRAAAARTTGISYTTISRIASGTQRSVQPETLEALSRALDVPLGRLRRAAGQNPDLPPFRLPARADQLTQAERKVVLGVIDALLEADHLS